ncbi:pilus assembly protein PilX [Pseudomonas sp. PIC25]|uniref:pilus assembly PilX family protein n=1 Tax=Pseudomonas sp. PIC25 TaxID=1958773 RepID=UPI000BABBC73|nr:PilX N-terminal domain-containing pilus assembly protein [Pseudomonas sp. PIC25]PAU66041.1 pilus assembly protein PilX [Pseudomonas sp. PIC25]
MKKNHEKVDFMRQRGSALIISLVFLLLLTMIGVSSIQDSTLQERMAGNERDRNLAFQAAEAALREGEAFLREQSPTFTASGTGGLLSPDYTGAKPTAANYPWASRSRAGASLAGVNSVPRYVIEWLTTQATGPSDQIEVSVVNSYRITARAVGGSTDAVVLLQATYSR